MATYLYPSTTTWPGASTWPGILPQSLAETHAQAVAERAERRARRLRPPLIRLWDGNWTLRGIVRNEIRGEFQLLDNETGIGTLEMPLDYFLSQWVIGHDERSTANVHITVDKDGIRWGGRLDEFNIVDDTSVVCTFRHDIEELKHIRCWPNPFLPAEIQFPRLWFMFGPAKWAIKMTLLANIMRLESSLWMLPDDPLDPAQWFNFDQSTWSMVVAPGNIAEDNSPFAIPFSRMKSAFDMAKSIMDDGQLSWSARRYLDGDPPPWPGANLRHGCLVWDIVDKSGWLVETSFGGNLATGLQRAVINIASDGLTEGIDIIDDPTFPPEYEQDWMGTRPVAPWVILRQGIGVQSSGFKWRPATDVQVTVGGHSMPGVNEMISFAINMAGDLIAAMIGIPPIGGAADALLEPLYTDTILAFMAWKSPQRATRAGWSHYHEHWGEGASRAYTLAALIALRTGMWSTREQTSHSVVVADGCPYLIGEQGFGHMTIGDRVGTTVKGMPDGKVYVDRISELTMGWSRDSSPAWRIQIGVREFEDPAIKALEAIQEIMSIAQSLGVL